MYVCIYICNHENNVPSRLSTQWLRGNSCTWAHDVRLTTYITLLALLVEHSLLPAIHIYIYGIHFELRFFDSI